MIETSTFGGYARTRRTRMTEPLRAFVREHHLDPGDMVAPLFVVEGQSVRNPIGSMPGQFQLSVDELLREVGELYAAGVPGVLLFGIPDQKDSEATGAWDENGIVQRAVAQLKQRFPFLLVVTDVCACEYTDHGHCGILVDGEVDNDATLPMLARIAVSHVRAGADIVAPSDMMDGRVAAIRTALDDDGFVATPILSYAAKYASAYYGPFREAAESTPAFGDRRSHQMDPGNVREAMREIEIDLDEGADMIMVKPALAYLDVIRAARERFDAPVSCYNVSGEYAMIKAAAERGWIDGQRVTMETLLSMKRAGAERIFTYHAKEVATWLQA
ncbi:MAG: porphobilinogen synthase [Chloroflexota bacterium]|nr:porphobilinogen synthase [Chloroflexota bacterium]